MPVLPDCKLSKKRPSSKAVLLRLRMTIRAKLNKVHELSLQREELLQEYQLLIALCDGLDFVKSCKTFAGQGLCTTQLPPSSATESPGDNDDDDTDAATQALQQQQRRALEAEAQLLQQLQQLPCVPVTSRDGSPAPTNGGVSAAAGPRQESLDASSAGSSSRTTTSCLAPAAVAARRLQQRPVQLLAPVAAPSDPLVLFREPLNRPVHPWARTITLPQLVAEYSATMRQMSVSMLLLESEQQDSGAGPCPLQQEPLERIRGCVLRYFNLLGSLVLAGRQELVVELGLTNIETGARLQSACVNHHIWLVKQMRLSEAQQRRIVHGNRLFGRLMAPLLSDLRDHQASIDAFVSSESPQPQAEAVQQASAAVASEEACAHGDAAAAAAAGGRQRHPGFDACALQACDELQEQEDCSQRLIQLLHKDFMLRMARAGFIFGCLSYYQIAQMMVLSTPYVPMAATLAFAVEQLAGEAEQPVAGSAASRQKQQQRQQQLQTPAAQTAAQTAAQQQFVFSAGLAAAPPAAAVAETAVAASRSCKVPPAQQPSHKDASQANLQQQQLEQQQQEQQQQPCLQLRQGLAAASDDELDRMLLDLLLPSCDDQGHLVY